MLEQDTEYARVSDSSWTRREISGADPEATGAYEYSVLVNTQLLPVA